MIYPRSQVFPSREGLERRITHSHIWSHSEITCLSDKSCFIRAYILHNIIPHRDCSAGCIYMHIHTLYRMIWLHTFTSLIQLYCWASRWISIFYAVVAYFDCMQDDRVLCIADVHAWILLTACVVCEWKSCHLEHCITLTCNSFTSRCTCKAVTTGSRLGPWCQWSKMRKLLLSVLAATYVIPTLSSWINT